MADNTAQNGTATIAADDIGGVLFQRMKVTFGPDGLATDVSSAAPLPITNYDFDFGQPWGSTYYRERLTAQSYTVLADGMADGMAAFWTTTVANGGTVSVVGGEVLVQTSANAAGSAQMVSTAPPYYPGQMHWFRCAERLGDTGSAGNIRRFGAFTVTGTTPQDGFAFELNGTTLNIVVFKAGVATTVASTAWSNVAVAPFTVDANFHLFEIRWTANVANFYIDNVLRHTATSPATPITASLNLPMAFQTINSSGATNRLLGVRNAGLGRLGEPPRDPNADVYYRGRSGTFRMPGRAGTAARRLLAIFNAAGSGRTVHVNQFTLDIVMTAAIAVTVLPPIIRVHRITAVPTNGTALTKVAKDNGGTSSASVTVYGDASADGTNSATALAATPVGIHLTQEYMQRMITAAGYEMADRIELLDGQDIVIRPGEGLVLSYDNITVATQEPNTVHTIATVDWTETA